MTAIEQRLAALEAEVARLRQSAVFADALAGACFDRGYLRGRESVTGRQAEPRSPRPRHLSVVGGGAS